MSLVKFVFGLNQKQQQKTVKFIKQKLCRVRRGFSEEIFGFFTASIKLFIIICFNNAQTEQANRKRIFFWKKYEMQNIVLFPV